MNRSQLVGDETGQIYVQTYDWHSKFQNFKNIPSVKKYHHFSFDCNNRTVALCKETANCCNDSSFCLFNDVSDVTDVLPLLVKPEGLSADRQWYLFEQIRNLVPERARDIVCPKPVCPRHTFAQTRVEKSVQNLRKRKSKPVDSAVVETPKRSKQACSYCDCSGHTNRFIAGMPVCPKRLGEIKRAKKIK